MMAKRKRFSEEDKASVLKKGLQKSYHFRAVVQRKVDLLGMKWRSWAHSCLYDIGILSISIQL